MVWPVTLRKATADDLPALAEIGASAARSTSERLPELRHRVAELPAAFAAFLPGDVDDIVVLVAGTALVGFVSADGRTGEIADLWVAPEAHRRGFGAMLLAAGEAAIRQAGHDRAWLTTHEGNVDALRFYRTNGYALVGVTRAQSDTLPGFSYNRARLEKPLSRPEAGGAADMAAVRSGIDTLDPLLVSLVAERFAFIDRAADLKPAIGMPARVSDRVEEVVGNARAQAAAIGFDPQLTEALWRAMVDLAIAHEERRMQQQVQQ